MKNVFVLLTFVLLFLGNIQGQKPIEWKGGTPGQETNWNCPRNWSTGKVPDSFSDVIIPDRNANGGFYPTLTKEAEVNSIYVTPTALEYTKLDYALLTVNSKD